MNNCIKIGTRKSELAMWQTNWVQKGLQTFFPNLKIDIEKISTTGDKILDVPLAKIGDKGLFTKELDIALLNGSIDLAVHSLKDVLTQLPDGLTIGAITERWDARDALITNGESLFDLPQGAKVATSSLRRKSQLLHARPDLQIVDVRGNLNTRFKKFDTFDWSAMVLAVAGVERLGMQDRITEKLSYEIMLPAVGQGSLAIICRENDPRILEFLKVLNHHPSEVVARAERRMLRTLEGGCQIPIGAFGQIQNEQLFLSGCIGKLDGSIMIRDNVTGPTNMPEEIGKLLANNLAAQGGKEILGEIVAEQRGTK